MWVYSIQRQVENQPCDRKEDGQVRSSDESAVMVVERMKLVTSLHSVGQRLSRRIP